MKECQTCKWWQRGSMYFTEPYGGTPRRVGWSASTTHPPHKQQEGECRIVAPHHSNGTFPVTYEFQGCGQHEENEE